VEELPKRTRHRTSLRQDCHDRFRAGQSTTALQEKIPTCEGRIPLATEPDADISDMAHKQSSRDRRRILQPAETFFTGHPRLALTYAMYAGHAFIGILPRDTQLDTQLAEGLSLTSRSSRRTWTR